MVWDREYTGHAMRAADLIELAVAHRVTLTGRWVKWITVADAEPTGEPLLDASLAALATAPKKLMPTDWMARQPAAGVVEAGLAVLDWALAGLVHECTLWIPGHFDRPAQRQYKEAARGERGKSQADPVEATIRRLMSDAHSCRNLTGG